jgi:hypothetical protein
MCLWIIFRITFSNSFPVVGSLLTRRRFGGNLGSLPGFGTVITFASFQDLRKREILIKLLIKCVKWTSGLLGRWHLECHQFFREFINFCKSHGRILSGGLLSTASSRALILAYTRRSLFSSPKSCGVNCFSKQSAIALAFSNGRNFRPKGPQEAVGALGPTLFRRDFAVGSILWGVTSQLPIFVSHRSRAFFRVIRPICFVTQLTAVLHAGSLVSCHIFRRLCLYFNYRSRLGRSFFIPKSVILLVDNLYAEVMETVKSRVALSASTPKLISTLGDINSEARMWNRSQSVYFSIDSERFQYVEYCW